MASPEELIAWQREWSTAWDTNDADGVVARFHPECVLRDYGVLEAVIGPDEARQHAVDYFIQTPGLTFKELNICATGDRVFQEWESAGSMAGPDGVMRDFRSRGTSVAQFNDQGQRVAMWTYWDILGYLQQLGLMSDDMKGALGH